MSDTQIAFLKGINVGGHRVTMEELRAALQPAGLTEVTTFIASGNVAFSTDERSTAALEGEIGQCLEEALGYSVETFVRQLPELARVASFAEALVPGDGWKAHVMFGRETPSPAMQQAFKDLETPDDLFRFSDREIVWLRHGGLSETSIKSSQFDRALERSPVTTRTLRTVQRILAKYAL